MKLAAAEKWIYDRRMRLLGLAGCCLVSYLLLVGKIEAAAAAAIVQTCFHYIDGRQGGPGDAE